MRNDTKHLLKSERNAERLTSSIIAAERERCAKLIPTSWCDELLSGKNAPKLPLEARAVEALLRGIQDRIRKSDHVG
jgi:hypothetical protein